MSATRYCSQCQREQRVTEPRAFGIDKLRSTLACGHIVLKETS